MSGRPELKLDWCTHEAARHAVMHWHYSQCMPMPPLNIIGAWEGGKFCGTVIFGRGASKNLGRQYGLTNVEVCELVRIALKAHEWPVTRMVAVAIGMLRKRNPGLRLIVSFADTNHGHHGGIYAGGNWIYSGMTPNKKHFRDKSGRIWHDRQATKTGYTQQFGKRSLCARRADCTPVELLGKHRYLFPLDAMMRAQIEPHRKPYPKCVRSVDSDTSANHAEESGATPTRTL